MASISVSFSPHALTVGPEPEREPAPGELHPGLPATGPRTNFTGLAFPAPASAFDVEAAVEYLDDEEYFPVLMTLLRSARPSILVTMFAVPERVNRERTEQVLKELCRAAERDVYVYIVLQMPQSEADPLSRTHSALAERLRSCGVDARLSFPMVGLHDKMVVVDLCKALIGSHNWSEGALTGEGVYESTALLVLPRQDIRFADYVFSRKVVSDMRRRDLWEREIAMLRHLGGMTWTEQQDYLNKLKDEDVSSR